MKYVFHTSCIDIYSVGEYGEDINEMVQNHHSIEIDNAEFISTFAESPGLKGDILGQFGVTESEFVNDWAISCYKSYFQGLECLYVRHSGIEYVFIREDIAPLVLVGKEAEARREKISELESALHSTESVEKALGRDEIKNAFAQFVRDNRSAFESNNILLASLFAYATPYADIVKEIDEETLL